MRRDLPSETVTFLFTDIEGSTKLLHELGPERYADALAEHRRVVRDAFARHGGVEVDTQGDAFFVAFPTADGAMRAAVEAQQDLALGPVLVRMGLHTGTPHLTGEGYVGIDVHQGARIAAAGHGGQILLSKETRELVSVEVTDLGEHRLKDFAQAVPIFQVGTDRFPPLKTISNTNLPRPVSSFIGRAIEVEEVTALLTDGARLITLTGPGGSGKTRLAIEAAAEALPGFKAGVFWVGLAPLRDPTLVRHTIATTVGAEEGLADHVGERQMLLLLDNFEQVIEAASDLSSLLAACPNLKVLVTSRELLRLQGEVEYSVPPLGQRDAIDLFAARSGLEPNPPIAELCRRLDNLPLAVELAAARTRVLTPSQILDRLSKRLDMLTGGRDADPRQRTLRATIEWSHDLLDEDEKRLFSRLAVFSGGCTLEAAEDVAGADPETLESLVDKSLVRRTGERFWMLETIREFASERLEEAPWGEEIRGRHADYFTRQAEEHDAIGGGAWADELQQRLEEEQANLRAALDWSCGGGDPTVALRLSAALWSLWWNLGAAREGTAWYDRALEVGRDQPDELRARAEYGAANMAMVRHDPGGAVVLLQRCLSVFRRVGDALRIARTVNDLGIAAQMKEDFSEARRYHEESMVLAEASGYSHIAASARTNLANAFLAEGRLDEAATLLTHLISTVPPEEDRAVAGTALHTLSMIDLHRDDPGRAATHALQSITIARDTHDWRGIAHALAVAAAVLTRRPDPAGAVRALAAGIDLSDAGLVLEVMERQLREESLAAVRAALGEEAFNRSMHEARALGRDELIDRVLSDLS